MINHRKAIAALDEYFQTKGRVLTPQEYVREADTPVRFQIVKQMFGSWTRMEKIIMARREPVEAATNADDVLAERNRITSQTERLWKEAAENQNKKAMREAEAQVVAERLAVMAATAEGATMAKLAIGGPLPKEQPRYENTGATVNIDPTTLERTVVDTKPEDVDLGLEPEQTEGELGKTPFALREEARAGTGDVETGDATGGGTTGSMSVDAAQAVSSPASEADPKTPTTESTAKDTATTHKQTNAPKAAEAKK